MNKEVFDQDKQIAEADEASDQAIAISKSSTNDDESRFLGNALENEARLARMKKSEVMDTSPNYRKRRALALAALIGAGASVLGVNTLVDMSKYDETVAEQSATLTDGETVEQLVRHTVEDLAEANDFEATNVQDIINEARQASEVAQTENGTEYNHSGDQFDITVEKNGFGQLRVDVEPIE